MVELQYPLEYDEINGLHGFLQKMDSCIAEEYHMDILDIDFKGTPPRWWVTYQDDIPN